MNGTMKYLIVNADDFGAGGGTSRGIVEAHRDGIVTSTSLLVNTPWSAAAATLAETVPDLGVGLHLDLDGVAEADVPLALDRQLHRFADLLGRPPTHVDTHHDAHRDPLLLPHVMAFARRHGLPLRGQSPARPCSKFYGQWDGETHPEQISMAGLERLLAAEVRDGVTELSCHPGYHDASLHSSYRLERELELKTLCDPAAHRLLSAFGITLISFRDLCVHGSHVSA